MTWILEKGVSVVICCCNSTDRLSETLNALAGQRFSRPLPWEIILVDNASSDNTPEFSRALWQQLGSDVAFRIVFEPVPGLGNARKKGIQESVYPIILFCDDDNWLEPTYVQHTFDILEGDPSIAACGGKGIPVFEIPRPDWFDDYAEVFALGSQEINNENGRILNLYGAGLAVRRKVLEELHASGFNPLMQGRVGKKLSSSEDTELTYAFVLMGYKLHYSDELRFFHYLPKERLSFDYLKKIFIAFGTDGPVRNLYYSNISHRFFHRRIRNWNFHLALILFRLVKYLIVPPKKHGRMIYFNWSLAYIRELFSIRRRHAHINAAISKIKGINTTRPWQNA